MRRLAGLPLTIPSVTGARARQTKTLPTGGHFGSYRTTMFLDHIPVRVCDDREQAEVLDYEDDKDCDMFGVVYIAAR